MENKNKNYGYLMVLASALMFGSYGVWSFKGNNSAETEYWLNLGRNGLKKEFSDN